jgi:opacity protein-like surface antigen
MTRQHLVVFGVSALAILLAAGPAAAQSAPPAPAVSIRGFALVGVEAFNASQTFKATMGTSSGPIYGGGGQVSLRSGIFVRVSASRYKDTGQRAISLEGQVFQLGIPLTATITPIEVTGGYRFVRLGRVVPYAGGGFGTYKYTETSEFADSSENVSASYTGYHVLGGVDVGVTAWLRAGGEVEYASVPNAFGTGGLSQEFNETNLGGTTFRVVISVGR